MGEFLGKFAEEILGLFKRNYRKPKLWIIIISIGFIFVLLIPYIDANFFYYNRMERRIEILQQVSRIDTNAIKSNDILNNEYKAILNEMKQNQERSINSVMNRAINLFSGIPKEKSSNGNNLIKFLTGSIWLIILTICIPFMNTFDGIKQKIAAFFVVLILTFILGFICMYIPIIITPMVNYIFIPLLQLVIIIVLAMKSNKKAT